MSDKGPLAGGSENSKSGKDRTQDVANPQISKMPNANQDNPIDLVLLDQLRLFYAALVHNGREFVYEYDLPTLREEYTERRNNRDKKYNSDLLDIMNERALAIMKGLLKASLDEVERRTK